MENVNLTQPQQKVVAAIAQAGAPTSMDKFDRRVVNGLAKKGLISLESTEQGLSAILTEAGLTVSKVEPKAKKAAKNGKKAKGAKKARAPKAEPGFCICGCGDKTLSAKRQFLQGHDATLHSLFLRIGRGEEKRSKFPNIPAALEYVRSAPWSTKAKRDAFDAAK